MARIHWEDLSVDTNITLERILGGDRVGRCGLDAPGSGYGPVAGCCEHGEETLVP